MQKVKQLWNALPEPVQRVSHTFWQSAGGVLVAGLVTVHSAADIKLLVAAAVAVGLAAAKAYILHYLDGLR